ncbi:expressed unknown protein [Seminavis robusta]|uniref:Uncharacterized protein n=1 Tax=Seminavis robusta TaxID=568900 RepID=A0A9N8DH66_9STRA|nr:expressed unknown protein [Seminavis robusta]|eukprot:Sro141_g065750.1 n/a (1135) ;mRNA; r:26842-30246
MSKRQVDEALKGDPEPEHVQKEAKKQADSDLEYVYNTVDTSTKSQRLFTEQNVVNLETLLDKESELGTAALPRINKGTQKQLHNFCLWYQDFFKKNGSDADWKPHFDEDSLARFENDKLLAALDTSNSSDGLLEEDLELVCEELDMPKSTRQHLAQLGIADMKSLLDKKTDLELFSLPNVKKTTQKALLKACLWHEDFYRKNDDGISWQAHFNDETLASFEQEPSVERDYRMALDRIHEGRGDGGISNVSEEMINYAATITTKFLNKPLLEQCRNKFSPFEVAVKCHRALMHPRGSPHDLIHLVSGKTQSGKSTVKAVCAAVHRQLSCLLIIITKGVPERDDLKIKLNKLLGGCRETMDAGLLVVADTGGQIAKATSAVLSIRKELPHARFGIIVDECDAMYRTKDCAQIMEQRYVALMDLGPSFRMEISATIYSALQALDEQGKQVEMMEIFTTEDYSGILEMKHAKAAGNDAFLNPKSLGPKLGVKYRYISSEVPKPIESKTPLLFSDEHKLNPKCSACKGACGCDMHSDVVSKRSWAVSAQSVIPYTSQGMMDMLDHMLPMSDKGGEEDPNLDTSKEGGASCTKTDVSNHCDAKSTAAVAVIASVQSPGDVMGVNDATDESLEKSGATSPGVKQGSDLAGGLQAQVPLADEHTAEGKENHKHVSNMPVDLEKQELPGGVHCTKVNDAGMQHDDKSRGFDDDQKIPTDAGTLAGKLEETTLADVEAQEATGGGNGENETEREADLAPPMDVASTEKANKGGDAGGPVPMDVNTTETIEDPEPSCQKGLLGLVATNPRVYAEGNVVVQAACVQNHFASKGKPFVAVVATGVGVYCRFPGCAKARFIRRSLKTVSEIITQIDKVVGLETPIIIFGYSRMCRCVSFRSSTRVPTHMILSRGPGYSLEDYIQALGRATFNGLSVLKQNGHSNVTILTNENDFLAAKKYSTFVQEVNVKIKENSGISLVEALRSATKKLPDEANCFRHTNRKIGRRKDLKMKIPGREAFEEPSSLNDLQNKKDRYWNDKMTQRVMKLFLELAIGDASFCCCTDELVSAYEETYATEEGQGISVGKAQLKKILTDLEKDVIFEKVKQEGDTELAWTAKSLVALENMLNETLEVPNYTDDENWTTELAS